MIPKALIVSGILITVAAIGLWASGGFHTGWSQDKVPVQKVDPITEIEYTEYEDRYVAGIEVLIGGIIFGDVLLLGGIFLNRRSKKQNS